MLRRFIEQSWLCFKGQKAQFEWEEFLLFDTLYPFVTLAFYCVVAGYTFQTMDVTDWVIGNAFLLCVNTCIFSLGSSFVSERAYGRIRSMIVSPASRVAMVLEKGVFISIETTITTFVGFLTGCIVIKKCFAVTDINDDFSVYSCSSRVWIIFWCVWADNRPDAFCFERSKLCIVNLLRSRVSDYTTAENLSGDILSVATYKKH